jgi:hypothetical protein
VGKGLLTPQRRVGDGLGDGEAVVAEIEAAALRRRCASGGSVLRGKKGSGTPDLRVGDSCGERRRGEADRCSPATGSAGWSAMAWRRISSATARVGARRRV